MSVINENGRTLNHPLDISKMTAEQAIQGTIEMWTDMMIKLGENPSPQQRSYFKNVWVVEHGYPSPFSCLEPNHISSNCFLCEYALRRSQQSADYNKIRCLYCPIVWHENIDGVCPCKCGKIHYLFTPIPEILEYIKNKENWKWTNSK